MLLSPRLAAILDALPLEVGMRVLELGCGPGALARGIAGRVGASGRVVGVDRSATAVAQAEGGSVELVESGRLRFVVQKVEELDLGDEDPFDLAVAIRVGALDGRHPRAGEASLPRIRAALAPGARLLIDGGDPLRELPLG